MKELARDYDFYELPEAERRAMVGKPFREPGDDAVYFPLQLTEDEGHCNYGRRQGLLRVSSLYKLPEGGKGFHVGVFSPDDWDLDLGIRGGMLRQEVIEFMRKELPKVDVTYRFCLECIRDRFGGEII